jgi:hypothetical protein
VRLPVSIIVISSLTGFLNMSSDTRTVSVDRFAAVGFPCHLRLWDYLCLFIYHNISHVIY